MTLEQRVAAAQRTCHALIDALAEDAKRVLSARAKALNSHLLRGKSLTRSFGQFRRWSR